MSWVYTEKDVIRYALSVGCTREETKYLYENDEHFAVLPTFGVLALHNGDALNSVDFGEHVPDFNPMLLLHGEQYMELHRPLPTSGRLETTTKVLDVIDKGRAALLILSLVTKNAESGEVILENEASIFLRGSGGFGKTEPKARKPAATAANELPSRPPDAVTEEQTNENLAALYRLNGDENPLHIDPQFADMAGFPKPILHGLCTFGISSKHVLKAFGKHQTIAMKSIKGRFVKHVFPGETLRTEMWQTGQESVIFQTKVVERDVIAISNAAVCFHERTSQPSKL